MRETHRDKKGSCNLFLHKNTPFQDTTHPEFLLLEDPVNEMSVHLPSSLSIGLTTLFLIRRTMHGLVHRGGGGSGEQVYSHVKYTEDCRSIFNTSIYAYHTYLLLKQGLSVSEIIVYRP